MTAISVLLIAKTHGGYAIGGLLVGVLGLAAALSGPLWGRIADRRGARTILLVTGIGQAGALVAFGPAVRAGAGIGLLIAAIAGTFRPPASGIVRTQWAALPPEPRRVMQALESALTEIVFVIGPVLVGVVLLIGTAGDALIAAASMVATGSIGLATALRAGPRDATRRVGDRWGPLRLPALRLLCLVFFFQVVAYASAEVGLTTLCANAGHSALSGPLIGVWATGSAVGGLTYGSQPRASDPARALEVLTFITAVLLGLFLVSSNPYILFAVAIPAGLSIAPGSQTVNGIIARAVPQSQHTEAFGWLSGAAPALGGSLGYALGAAIAQSGGPRLSLAFAVGMALLAPVAIALRRSDLTLRSE